MSHMPSRNETAKNGQANSHNITDRVDNIWKCVAGNKELNDLLFCLNFFRFSLCDLDQTSKQKQQ